LWAAAHFPRNCPNLIHQNKGKTNGKEEELGMWKNAEKWKKIETNYD